MRALESARVHGHTACLVRMRARERPFPSSSPLTLGGTERRSGRLAQIAGNGFGWTEADMVLWPLCRAWLKRRVRALRPKVLHAHFGPDAVLVEPIASASGIPLVASFYGYDVSRLLAHSSRRWERRYQRLFRKAHCLLAISEHVRRRLLDIGAPEERTLTIPLGCDLERFPPRPPRARFDGRTVRFLHVGRLTAKKDPLVLLEAFARARSLVVEAGCSDRKLELTIAGDGELWRATQETVRRLGVQDAVHLLGSVPHARVPELLGQAHVYSQHCRTAANQDQEGLGVTFIEASASALPVVTTRHTGVPEVVLHECTGLLSPEGDVEAMARNLATLALEPERWDTLGKAGRRHVEESFALHKVTQRLAELYTRLADNGAVPSERDHAAATSPGIRSKR